MSPLTGDVPPPATPSPPPLTQILPWDFKTTFPEPLPEAIREGLFEEDDPDHVRWIHKEHANEALAVLEELDVVLDARRRGVDPKTGKKPTRPKTSERLDKFFETEPARLERWFGSLMGAYEDAFGVVAAMMFERAIRAWHAGIEVVAEKPAAASVVPIVPAEPNNWILLTGHGTRITARLPVPKPLPSAVASGHFGQEEDGRNVRPGPHEVRAITEQYAEKLIKLVESIGQAKRDGAVAEQDWLKEQLSAALAAYAEDFGDHAAQQLGAYVHRQAGLDLDDGRGR